MPHPPNPESHTHHQDVSTRAGSVSSSSSSSRQARLKRADAREPSGAAGLSAGAETGARARRGESCAASSAPPCLRIAPQTPAAQPGGAWTRHGLGVLRLLLLTPLGGHRLAGAWGLWGTWAPGAGAQGPEEGHGEGCPEADDAATSSGTGACCLGVGCGVRGSVARSGAAGRSVWTAPPAAGSHWTARGGAEAGDTRGPQGGSARAALERRCALGVAAASAPRRPGAALRRAPTCSSRLRGAPLSAPSAQSFPTPRHRVLAPLIRQPQLLWAVARSAEPGGLRRSPLPADYSHAGAEHRRRAHLLGFSLRSRASVKWV